MDESDIPEILGLSLAAVGFLVFFIGLISRSWIFLWGISFGIHGAFMATLSMSDRTDFYHTTSKAIEETGVHRALALLTPIYVSLGILFLAIDVLLLSYSLILGGLIMAFTVPLVDYRFIKSRLNNDSLQRDDRRKHFNSHS